MPSCKGTLMQPLQCDLRCKVASPHIFTHMATEHGNNHAAITMRSAAPRCKTACRMCPRMSQENMTTIMQPFQCDLRPQTPKRPLTTHANTPKAQGTVTLREQGHIKKTGAAPAAYTRYLSLPPAATLHEKTQCLASQVRKSPLLYAIASRSQPTSHSHHFYKSPCTSPRHRFPKSTHFTKSPLLQVLTKSPLHQVTTSLSPHFRSKHFPKLTHVTEPPLLQVTASPLPYVNRLHKVAQVFLPVTRKIASQLPLTNIYIYIC